MSLRRYFYNPFYSRFRDLDYWDDLSHAITPWEIQSLINFPRLSISPRIATDLKPPTVGKDGFQVCIDVQQFQPNEITVKTTENEVIVEGKHEERSDEHGSISRQFIRKYSLPENYKSEEVISTLSSDGVLTIKAPPPQSAIENKNERVVQIQQTGPAHLNVKENPSEDKKTE